MIGEEIFIGSEVKLVMPFNLAEESFSSSLTSCTQFYCKKSGQKNMLHSSKHAMDI